MSEETILQLLNSPCDKILTSQAKFHANVIENASETLTKIIYSTRNNECGMVAHQRQQFVQFLSLFNKNSPGHMQLDKNNYGCAAQAINAKIQNAELEELLIAQDEEELENEEICSEQSISPDNILFDVIKHYEQMDQRKLQQDEILSRIIEIDQEQLEHFTFYKKPRMQYQSMNEFLKKLFYNTDNETDLDTIKMQQLKTKKKQFQNMRLSQVECAYALYNLMTTVEDKRAFEKIVQRISFHSSLSSVEREFLAYVIGNADSNVDAAAIILRHFNQLYEKPMLQFCTTILSEGAVDCDTVLNSVTKSSDNVLKAIWKVSKNNFEIRLKIVWMLFELFSLSGYNEKLLAVVGALLRSES